MGLAREGGVKERKKECKGWRERKKEGRKQTRIQEGRR